MPNPNMYIRSKIEREGGSRVSMLGKTYHFKPDSRFDQSPHLAEVEANSQAFAQFLSIPEGYEVFIPPTDLDTVGQTGDDGTNADDRPQIGLGILPTGGDGDSQTGGDGDNQTGGEQVSGFTDLQTVLASAGNIHGVSRETLNSAFHYLESRSPHPKAKDETVAAKIFEIAADRGMILEAPEEITTDPVTSDEPETNNE